MGDVQLKKISQSGIGLRREDEKKTTQTGREKNSKMGKKAGQRRKLKRSSYLGCEIFHLNSQHSLSLVTLQKVRPQGHL